MHHRETITYQFDQSAICCSIGIELKLGAMVLLQFKMILRVVCVWYSSQLSVLCVVYPLDIFLVRIKSDGFVDGWFVLT